MAWLIPTAASAWTRSQRNTSTFKVQGNNALEPSQARWICCSPGTDPPDQKRKRVKNGSVPHNHERVSPVNGSVPHNRIFLPEKLHEGCSRLVRQLFAMRFCL